MTVKNRHFSIRLRIYSRTTGKRKCGVAYLHSRLFTPGCFGGGYKEKTMRYGRTQNHMLHYCGECSLTKRQSSYFNRRPGRDLFVMRVQFLLKREFPQPTMQFVPSFFVKMGFYTISMVFLRFYGRRHDLTR